MKTTTLRIEDNLFFELKKLAKEMGISFNSLLIASLKKVLKERKIEICV